MQRLGEFYREKVLSLSKKLLRKIEMEYSPENLRIEKDLFGWKLYYTRFGRKTENFIECRSEEEARYLKVFLEAGMGSVKIPKDDEYLKNILPELERLKAKSDKIINSYLESIVGIKIRSRIKQEVWAEILK